jgi:hypothetical protein
MGNNTNVWYILISASISYIYFMMESITNYNLGKDTNTFQWNIPTLLRLFRIPPLIEVFKISLTVGTFALLSSITFKILDYVYFNLLK